MGNPFISQNITLATGGFTYENGILTPAEAKTIYNLNVPSNVLVSANGLLWIKLNSTKTAAQIGWTDMDCAIAMRSSWEFVVAISLPKWQNMEIHFETFSTEMRI